MAAPLPQDGLASQLPSELFDEVLTKADVPTLLKIKGVSRSWRAGARRVLWVCVTATRWMLAGKRLDWEGATDGTVVQSSLYTRSCRMLGVS